MIKCRIFFVIIGIFTSCSVRFISGESTFNGKVKSCLLLKYEVNKISGKVEKGKLLDYGHQKWNFDKKGNYTTYEYLDSEYKILEKTIPGYSKGKILEEIVYNRQNEIESHSKYTYISKSEIEFERLNKHGTILFKGTILKKRNKIIQQEFTAYRNNGAKERMNCFYNYDHNDNLIIFKQTKSNGEIISLKKYQYLEFDDKKNWTKRLVSYPEYADEPKHMEILKIEYY